MNVVSSAGKRVALMYACVQPGKRRDRLGDLITQHLGCTVYPLSSFGGLHSLDTPNGLETFRVLKCDLRYVVFGEHPDQECAAHAAGLKCQLCDAKEAFAKDFEPYAGIWQPRGIHAVFASKGAGVLQWRETPLLLPDLNPEIAMSEPWDASEHERALALPVVRYDARPVIASAAALAVAGFALRKLVTSR